MIPLRDKNPSGSFPAVTVLVIVACVLAFLYELALGRDLGHFFGAYALIPGQVTYALQYGGPDWPRVVPPFFTSMFLHGGWLHLIGNMWFLWIFGDNVEDTLGRVRFTAFYFLCGLAAGVTHYLLERSSVVPTVGASGAIAGVLAGYAVLFPRARVVALVPLGFLLQMIEVPAVFFLGFWFLLQLFSGTLSIGGSGGGVAWWAHVGGFVAGFFFVSVLRPRRGSA